MSIAEYFKKVKCKSKRKTKPISTFTRHEKKEEKKEYRHESLIVFLSHRDLRPIIRIKIGENGQFMLSSLSLSRSPSRFLNF